MFSHKPKKLYHDKEKGVILILSLVFVSVFLIVGIAILDLITQEYKLSVHKQDKERAFHVAEAGVDYYRWHLNHDNDDFCDGETPGTGNCIDSPYGPFIHYYKDSSGNVIGQFSLSIIPPEVGSTIATIESTGYLNSNPSLTRIIEAKVGLRSLAEYGFLTNDDVWFGDTETTVGKVHSNGGIRHDGYCDSIIESSKKTYTCQTYHGCNPPQQKPGVWGSGTNCSSNFWHYPPQYPVENVSFTGITQDLADIEDEADIKFNTCPPGQCKGYHIKFNANGTFTAYKVTQTRYSDGRDVNWNIGDHYIDIMTEEEIPGYVNYNMPSDGLIFVADKTWVDGTVNGRVTVAAAKFPDHSNTNKSIIINGDLVYSTKDGSDAIGLMAQKDILIPRYAPYDLEIDGAIMAQKGSTQRYYYTDNILGTITTYGSTISNGVWTWSWVSGGGQIVSGYQNTSTSYDANLIYAPPPSFTTTSDHYELISWQEK